MPLAERLYVLDTLLADLLIEHNPEGAAVEEVFVNTTPNRR